MSAADELAQAQRDYAENQKAATPAATIHPDEVAPIDGEQQ